MLGEPRRGWKEDRGEETWAVTRVPGREEDEVSTRPDYVVLFGDDGNTGRERYENLKVRGEKRITSGGRGDRALLGAMPPRPPGGDATAPSRGRDYHAPLGAR